MLRAYDVMTRAVATCPPDAPLREVAAKMRDLNIGDVLVVEDGKLRGIVTDRDLTVQALAEGVNPQTTTVDRCMSTHLVTGQADWSLEQIAEVMGKHQIRRLPITQNDALVGIVSLGDVALHAHKRNAVSESLKNISETTRARIGRVSPIGKFVGLAVPMAAAAVFVLVTTTKQGKQLQRQVGQLQKQFQKSGIPNRALDALNTTRVNIQDPKTRKQALELTAQTRKKLGDLSTQLTHQLPQKPRAKRFLFV